MCSFPTVADIGKTRVTDGSEAYELRSAENGRGGSEGNSDLCRLRASVGRAHGALAECRELGGARRERLADLQSVPKLWPEDPGAEVVRCAERSATGGVAGWSVAVALHLHVDLRRDGADLPHLSDRERTLEASAVHAEGPSWCLADSASLLPLRPQARIEAALQSAAEASVYVYHLLRRRFHFDRIGDVQAGAIRMARLDDGRIR